MSHDQGQKNETAIFAAGCFWGIEQSFAQLTAVLETQVGYIGGHTENPTYEDVCTGQTGHAEAVKVLFDPQKTTFNDLIQHFWKLHNPTSVNFQGPDIGTQYRSAIFATNEEQLKQAKESKEELEEQKVYDMPIATEIQMASTFYPAEEYHQKYFEKQNRAGCRLV